MAIARIVHHWPDDDGCTVFEVEIEASHPDATDVARTNVTRMWRDVVGDEAPADIDMDLGE